MRRFTGSLLLVLLAFTTPAVSNAEAHGPHGGSLRLLGPYWGELVVSPERVDLFLTDRERRVVDARAVHGSITFFKDSVRHGVLRLTSTDINVLSASGETHTEPGVEAVITLWLRNGSAVQARYPAQ